MVGAGAGHFGAEHTISASHDLHIADMRITGEGAGLSFGPQLGEAHAIYTHAVYQPGLSYAATTIYHWLGILQ